MAPAKLLLLLLLVLASPVPLPAALPGEWRLLVADAGIASMHTAVTRFNTVVLLDRTHIGASRKLLPNNRCLVSATNRRKDCTAHSVVLDLETNAIRTLTILTDTWCSSGQFMPDGSLIQTGGDLDGYKKFRRFTPCDAASFCDWEELENPQLHQGRWYATNQILPDGSIIIVGGKSANSVEFFPPKAAAFGAANFSFLREVEDNQMDNLYPYVHLLPNGELFIFANNRAVSYNYKMNAVTRTFPVLEGGPRNYPSAGSSVMLALSGDYSSATIVICGGAVYGAYLERSTDSPARGSCGRIEATGVEPNWETESMPFGRIMGDMVMLPTGDVLIINGAQAGTQGFELASDPCLYPVLYRPDQPLGLRFMNLNPGTIPRMYHSTANLLPDGRVLIAGSNPHYFYKFDAEFPTELRIEAFSPEYLSSDRSNIRPTLLDSPQRVVYGQIFEVEFVVELPVVGIVEVNLASAPFATHSFSQGQRLVKLSVETPTVEGGGLYRIKCVAPPTGNVAPPGYYMAFAVNLGVPSVAKWIQLVA